MRPRKKSKTEDEAEERSRPRLRLRPRKKSKTAPLLHALPDFVRPMPFDDDKLPKGMVHDSHDSFILETNTSKDKKPDCRRGGLKWFLQRLMTLKPHHMLHDHN